MTSGAFNLRARPEFEQFRAAGLRSYMMVPMIDLGKMVGLLFLGSDRPAAYNSEHIEVSREVADHLAIAIRQAVLFEENRSARARLESLSRRLIRVEEEERRRVARELHDEIGQALTALNMNLHEVVGAGRGDRRRLAESTGIVAQLLQRVRGMSLDLRPPMLDDLGLTAALQWYVRRFAERTGLESRFDSDPDPIEVDPEVGTACFRLVQEALTNVARHASARRVRVGLLRHPGGLRLVVADDGVGFDPETAMEAASRGASLGLAGMRERVELIGGKIAIISRRGIGTEIRVEFANPA